MMRRDMLLTEVSAGMTRERKKRPSGAEDRVNVKLPRWLKVRAETVAVSRNIDLIEYLVEKLQAPVTADWKGLGHQIREDCDGNGHS
jgi:hypothetical protein